MRSAEIGSREAIVRALSDAEIPPDRRAEELDAAAALLLEGVATDDAGATATAARALSTALSCLGDLERWEVGTLAAEVDAERHRRAAERKAAVAAASLDAEDPLFGRIHELLERV